MRPDWDEVKKQVMLTVLMAKFTQNPELRDLLVKTGEAPLVEANHWHDNYWGRCDCQSCVGVGALRFKPAYNYLGKLLECVRLVVRPEDEPWISMIK
jgi:ribA/ribD-fused uncharacterized protein